jgi:YidC/Oxa1 family membrane protein insertase
LADLGRYWDLFIQILEQGLGFFYGTFDSWGVRGGIGWAAAIIAFTVVIKLVTLPLTWQQLKSSKAMQELQPKLKEIQKQYGKDKEKQMQEQMRLYKEHGVNPALGCVPMLIQMPVWFALYQALFRLGQPLISGTELPNPYFETFAQPFLWIANLAQPEALLQWPPHGWPILIIITGASQWILQKMMTPASDDPQQQMMSGMMQFMPLMFVFFSFQVPAGLVVYWVTSNLFSMVQQYFITGWGGLLPTMQRLGIAPSGPVKPALAAASASDGQASPGISDDGSETGDGDEPGSKGRRRRGKKRK